MKKKIYIIILMCLNLMAFSQSPSNTIRAQGKSQIEVQPDLFTFSFRFEVNTKNQSTSVDSVNSMVNRTIDLLNNFEIDEDSIKTTDFSLSVNDNRYNPEIGVEFYARQSLELTINAKSQAIMDLLNAITDAELAIYLNTKSSVSQKLINSKEKELIQMAFNDSKNQAKILADASGVKVGAVVSADLTNQSSSFGGPMTLGETVVVGYGNRNMESFNFSSKVLQRSVTVIFQIHQ